MRSRTHSRRGDAPRATPKGLSLIDVQPGRIGRTQEVLTQDAYGRGPVQRLLTPLRGLVRPGNSGGPLVGVDGRVLTTVFAGTISAGRTTALTITIVPQTGIPDDTLLKESLSMIRTAPNCGTVLGTASC